MGQKPLRPCRHPGCTVLCTGGYCEQHQPKRQDTRSQESKAWRGWYKLDVWTKDLRPTQLALHPWCAECAKQGLRVRATDVDHIVDHKGNWSLFTDRSNLQSLCHSCHSRKTVQDLRKAGKLRPR